MSVQKIDKCPAQSGLCRCELQAGHDGKHEDRSILAIFGPGVARRLGGVVEFETS